MSAVVWLSGRFLRANVARVPATSAAVTHGLGLFESMRLVRGELPLLDLHLARLRTSCMGMGLDADVADWRAVTAELAARNRMKSGVVRITLARDFALASCRRLPRGLAAERERGISLGTAPIARPAASLKSTSRADLWLAERAAGGEVALLGPGRRLLETSLANLFIVSRRGLETAPAPHVLPGIARGLVVELARGLGVPVRLRAPRLAERAQWREAFATNAVRGVRPVVRIDAATLPLPGSGSLTRQLQKALDQRMRLA